jgi:hypothetical protein
MTPHRSLIAQSVRTIKDSAVNSHIIVRACLLIMVCFVGCYFVFYLLVRLSVACPCYVACVGVSLCDVSDLDDLGSGAYTGVDNAFGGDCAYLCNSRGRAV